MEIVNIHKSLRSLQENLKGKINTTNTYREIYATDASIYYEKPVGVAFPTCDGDIRKIIEWANKNHCPLIPRGAGTSLAGQVVGKGLVVDVARHMNSILEVDEANKSVKVQPGVVLDELNLQLKSNGLLFGPETSTANRCVVGGMLGNNSCGLHSPVYGAVRDHILEVSGFLSNGEEVTFKPLSQIEFDAKCELSSLEGDIYRHIKTLLRDKNIDVIRKAYPHKNLHRRNSGYALDILAEMIADPTTDFNMAKFIAGSEGTLFFATQLTLNLLPLPPKEKALLCVHCHSVHESLLANIEVLKSNPTAVELMDRPILDLATKNSLQNQNLFFIHGKPEAVLMTEFWAETKAELEAIGSAVTKQLKDKKLGYSYPLVFGNDIKKVWNVRKAGLGVMMNMLGDAKPTCIIEDTAVIPEKLPDFISEMDAMLNSYAKEAVYYAHAATGELHIRPIINLKSETDRKVMRNIASDTMHLVKKYKGSISGEHGDGRLRGEFLKDFYGQEIYQWFRELKTAWDPNGIFNPNKIIDTPPMDSNLRVHQEQQINEQKSAYSWEESLGHLRAVERCTGAGDCRKSEIIGGTMCPSFMALKDEKASTRARANALRSFLYGNQDGLNEKDVLQVLDLCLSCKACKTECPSNVDMAKLKAEFLHRYYQKHLPSLQTQLIGNYAKFASIATFFPALANAIISSPFSSLIKKCMGFHSKRSLPGIQKFKFKPKQINGEHPSIIFFLDEFTKNHDGLIGVKAIQLLETLGYRVIIPDLKESGRTFISKGLLKKAAKVAQANVEILQRNESLKSLPIVGLEPSAILTFRDEYPDLLHNQNHHDALQVSKRTFTIEEYLHKEWKRGAISDESFSQENAQILFHGHCYQKSLSSTLLTQEILSIPKNYLAHEINSGCCGMAGSFGFEKKHYDLSMQVAEMKLLPTVRNAEKETIIVAAGTSCRHQIKDGTQKQALHPVEVLFNALK